MLCFESALILTYIVIDTCTARKWEYKYLFPNSSWTTPGFPDTTHDFILFRYNTRGGSSCVTPPSVLSVSWSYGVPFTLHTTSMCTSVPPFSRVCLFALVSPKIFLRVGIITSYYVCFRHSPDDTTSDPVQTLYSSFPSVLCPVVIVYTRGTIPQTYHGLPVTLKWPSKIRLYISLTKGF